MLKLQVARTCVEWLSVEFIIGSDRRNLFHLKELWLTGWSFKNGWFLKSLLLAKLKDSSRVQTNPFSEVKSQKVWYHVFVVGSYKEYTSDCVEFLTSSCNCLQDWGIGIFFSQNFPTYPIAHVQLNFCLACWHSSVHVPPLEQGLSSQHLLLHGWFEHALFVS